MESDTEYDEEAVSERSQIPSPQLPTNVLQTEKDFILMFETIPELWDNKNPVYTNKYKRNENLAKLLPILKIIKPNATIEEVKKKINTIRSNYRRELKKVISSQKSGAGAGEMYVPKLWYFPYLQFLQKLDQPLALAVHDQGQSRSPTTHAPQETSKDSIEDTLERSFSPIAPVPKPSPRKRKKRKVCAGRNSKPSNKETNLPNPIALEWSNILDRLDPMQRLYAKKAINDILFEAELGNLNRDSVLINYYSSR